MSCARGPSERPHGLRPPSPFCVLYVVCKCRSPRLRWYGIGCGISRVALANSSDFEVVILVWDPLQHVLGDNWHFHIAFCNNVNGLIVLLACGWSLSHVSSRDSKDRAFVLCLLRLHDGSTRILFRPCINASCIPLRSRLYPAYIPERQLL